eukprot:346889-Chlamydomonas_euryale.AAC.1
MLNNRLPTITITPLSMRAVGQPGQRVRVPMEPTSASQQAWANECGPPVLPCAFFLHACGPKHPRLSTRLHTRRRAIPTVYAL